MARPTQPTFAASSTSLPWLVAAGALSLVTILACGGGDENNDAENNATENNASENNNTMTPDMSTPVDQGGGAEDMGSDPVDQGGGEDQGGGGEDMAPDMTPEEMGEDMAPEDMTVEPPSAWTVYSHPCAGNRTDALFCDDDSTCYTGCGTTTEGRGMFVTEDGGETWGTLDTTPEDIFNGSRVNDIWRSPDDGKLYVAGEHTAGFRVLAVKDGGELEEIWKKGTTVDYSFTAGSFRRGSSGRAIAESLNGNGIVYRAEDSTDPLESWTTGYGFWQDQVPAGVQILAMDVLGDDFYASGSTINQPPTVFLPAWDDEFDFDILQMVEPGGLSSFNGELWDIDVNEEGIIVGGVNQSAGRGIVYIFNFEDGKSPNDRANWTYLKVNDLIDDQSTWVQGVCRGEEGLMYAVGREPREGWGFVLRSKDGGGTWEDISPYPAGSSKSSLEDAYRCHVTSSGGVIVAGAGGMFAVYEE